MAADATERLDQALILPAVGKWCAAFHGEQPCRRLIWLLSIVLDVPKHHDENRNDRKSVVKPVHGQPAGDMASNLLQTAVKAKLAVHDSEVASEEPDRLKVA